MPHFARASGSFGWRTTPLGAPGTISSMSAVTGGRVFVVTTDHAIDAFDDQSGWVNFAPSGFAQSIDTVDNGAGIVTLYAVGVNLDVANGGKAAVGVTLHAFARVRHEIASGVHAEIARPRNGLVAHRRPVR